MNYLISVKNSIDGTPIGQDIVPTDVALNFVRDVMLTIQPMEETSADIQAMNFINMVEVGKPMLLESNKTGRVLIVQIFEGEKHVYH